MNKKKTNILILLLSVLLIWFVYQYMVIKEEITMLKTSQYDTNSEESPFFTNYMPIFYRDTEPQMVGQTFSVDQLKTIKGIKLKSSYGKGNKIVLTLHELGSEEAFDIKPLIASSSYEAERLGKEAQFDFTFNEPTTLTPNTVYIMFVKPENNVTDAGIAFAEKDIYSDGRMYIFTRLSGGNGRIIQSKHSWQARNDADLIFELIE